MGYMIGVDVGGTFTDFSLFNVNNVANYALFWDSLWRFDIFFVILSQNLRRYAL